MEKLSNSEVESWPAGPDLELQRSIEAILMVVDEPVTELTLASVLGRTLEEVISARQIDLA